MLSPPGPVFVGEATEVFALGDGPDEPEDEQDRQAAGEARDWLQRNGGKGIPHSEAMRRLGLE